MSIVSDLVDTLIASSPALGLVSWVRHNQSALRAKAFLARMLPRDFLARLGLKDLREFGEWRTVGRDNACGGFSIRRDVLGLAQQR
ncbi:MAG: hypothetical protein BMS9Abin28_1029 [Anaerolineae bacterium]|nr:MAG: hypothetical protein BMS9Abin28_1029 [Anaerolineae bacterium]